jgi:Leucine-rich repeat (LRR) protein
MSGIQTVTFPTSISSLPSYLCSLPSHIIDLSHQAFTTLSDATFPCLDAFTKVTLSYNQITSVNMASGDFKNLTILDLSSNQLTTLPYSILRPTPTSLRYLDLRNNSITSIDLFIYTLQNITINLDNNPINSSVIINPQNATLGINTTSTVNVTFPAIVTSSTIIIQDTTVASVIACSSFTSIRSFLLNFRSATTSVLLQCTCASFSLKQLYQTNGYDITKDFSCSSGTDGQTFSNLTSTSCPNAVSFQLAPCTTGVCLIIFNFFIEIIFEKKGKLSFY